MIYNNVIAREVAESLLDIKAVVLKPSEPFTWASGLKSPIYCDNRQALSHPRIRRYIKNAFADLVVDEFQRCNVIAGVATGAIAQGALVADILNLPFVYVRDKAKAHGMGNRVEGKVNKGDKVVVIEDLISTGGSSLSAVDALREAGAEVVGLAAIFTYSFSEAKSAFEKAGVNLFTLSDYPTLLDKAADNNYITEKEKGALLDWYKNPKQWSDAHSK